MPRVPYPDPLYPVVWADAPNGPDSFSPPAGGVAPPDDDDPFQLHLDEALVRKADNDAVDQWKSLSGPWFASRGEDAATRWQQIEQSLNEIVHRPLGALETERQRRMYRDIMAPRLEAWGDEARAHATREAQAFNDTTSQQRQDLAQAAMRRGARLGDMRAVAEGERRLVGEVRGRSSRQGLDADAAEAQALGAAHSDMVEHLAQHDPRQAQDWLNAHGATIGDPAKVDKLHRMLQPYAAEQQQEGLADQLRDETSDLPAQHAAVDAMGLDPAIAEGLKQRLTDMAESDRRATEKEQDAAFSRVMAIVLNPETQSLRSISPSDYYMLTPERLDLVRAVMAANLRSQGSATSPEPYRIPTGKAAQAFYSSADTDQMQDNLSNTYSTESNGVGVSFIPANHMQGANATLFQPSAGVQAVGSAKSEPISPKIIDRRPSFSSEGKPTIGGNDHREVPGSGETSVPLLPDGNFIATTTDKLQIKNGMTADRGQGFNIFASGSTSGKTVRVRWEEDENGSVQYSFAVDHGKFIAWDPSLSGKKLENGLIVEYGEKREPIEVSSKTAKSLANFVPREQWGARTPDFAHLERFTGSYNAITLHHSGSQATPQEVESLHRGDFDPVRSIASKVKLAQIYHDADVGYNYMIGKDGRIYEGRSLSYEGAHVHSHNKGNIGIVLLGDYTHDPAPAAQVESAKALIEFLMSRYPIKTVLTHGDYDSVKKNELIGARSQFKGYLTR